MLAIGNYNINSLLEYRVPNGKKPTPNLRYEEKATYIKKKYASRLYAVSFSELCSNMDTSGSTQHQGDDNSSTSECAYTSYIKDNLSQKTKIMIKSMYERDVMGALMIVMMDVDVNHFDDCSETPLMVALCSTYSHPIEQVLHSNLDWSKTLINEKSLKSYPLISKHEVTGNRFLICELLTQNGAQCDLSSSVDMIYYTFSEEARLIYNSLYPINDSVTTHTLTPLHIAVTFMDLELIVYLIKKCKNTTEMVDDLNRTAGELLKCVDISLFENFQVQKSDLETLYKMCESAFINCNTIENNHNVDTHGVNDN